MSEQTEIQTTSDVSAAFDLLRDARRRGVLYTVMQNGRTSVSELARRIAAWQSAEGDESPDAVTVETSLVHVHLPKLDDAGVIEYDHEERTVRPAEAASELDPLLAQTREREPGLVRAARTTNLERALEI
jgi:predicted transcriptional regulator